MPGIFLIVVFLFFACTNGVMQVGAIPQADTASDTAPSADTSISDDDAGVQCADGVPYESLCWFLGAPDESCLDVCTRYNGFDEAATAIIGTPDQMGTWSACRDIVRLLGFDEEVAAGYRTDGAGIGCHIWENGEIWWLYDPNFDPAAHMTSAQIVCGCSSS